MTANDHGRTSTYTNHRCRCDECRAAVGAAVRAWKETAKAEIARTGELPAYVSHGTVNAYMNYGCRCEPCRASKSDYAQSRNAARS